MMPPFGVYNSLHSLVHGAETLLSRAESACNTLRSGQKPDHACAALVQLDQALLDGKGYMQREYDHISNAYGSQCASQGDQTVLFQFWTISGSIEEHLTQPLEDLVRQFHHHDHSHGHGHGHGHGHCHCRVNHHHHHHSHGIHLMPLVLVSQGSHHHHDSHHQLADYEPKFHTMLNEWGNIKDNISACFDAFESRLKTKKDSNKGENKGSGSGSSSGNGQPNDKDKSVANACHGMIEATNKVDEEVRMINNVYDKICVIGKRLREPSPSPSSSSSCISVSIN